MNIKKIAAVIAASMTICFSSLNFVYAEETEESSVAQENAEETKKISKDSLWRYTIQEDEETKEEYACIENYIGHDTEIVIPEEIDGNVVRMLGNYAFYENEQVTKIIISENLTYFGNFPFFGCSSLKEFEVNEKNKIYETKDGVLFGDDSQLFVCYPPAKPETEYTIPDGVIALNSAAFACCVNLEKINFPDTLEEIGLYCFAECTSLNNVVIPEKVQELGSFNFTGCTSLTDITFPDEMSVIGNGAFFSCTSLKSIEFPEGLMEIGQAAFVSTGFTEIEIPYTVQEIGYSAFGFTTDISGQIIPMDSFVVKGLTGSMAQSYCADEGNENIKFESVDEKYIQESTSDKNDSKEKSNIKPGIIIAIVIVFIAAIASAVLIPLRGRKKASAKNNSDKISDNEEKTDDENDE